MTLASSSKYLYRKYPAARKLIAAKILFLLFFIAVFIFASIIIINIKYYVQIVTFGKNQDNPFFYSRK